MRQRSHTPAEAVKAEERAIAVAPFEPGSNALPALASSSEPEQQKGTAALNGRLFDCMERARAS